jgi:hypothetical protein
MDQVAKKIEAQQTLPREQVECLGAGVLVVDLRHTNALPLANEVVQKPAFRQRARDAWSRGSPGWGNCFSSGKCLPIPEIAHLQGASAHFRESYCA